MQNQLSKGDAIDVVAPSDGVVSGQGYLIASMFGVSPVTAAAGTSISLWLVGVYSLKKNSAEAWTVGQLIYWDNTAKQCTANSNSGANAKIGTAMQAAANPSQTGLTPAPCRFRPLRSKEARCRILQLLVILWYKDTDQHLRDVNNFDTLLAMLVRMGDALF